MQDAKNTVMLAEPLSAAFRELGFRSAPPAAGAKLPRAVRGHCEVHVDVAKDTVSLGIPIARIGTDRPATPLIRDYLAGRNEAGKGPGLFSVEDDTIWYRASVEGGDPATAAAVALAMQKVVEKIGPKILNILL